MVEGETKNQMFLIASIRLLKKRIINRKKINLEKTYLRKPLKTTI